MKNYGQSGVSSELEFGKNGTKLKNNASDQMQVLQNDGTSLSRMNGADPIDAQDFVTKGYLEREPDTIASGNIETGSETGSFVGQTFVVTKSGLSAPFNVLGSLHYWDGTDWVAVAMADGLRLSVDDTITGTDFTLEEGFLYIYDLDLNATYGWNTVGPAAVEQNLYKAVSNNFSFADQGGNVSLGTIPAGSVIDEIVVNITTAFDGTSPSLVVELADATVVQDSSLNDPEEIGLYQNDAYIINSTSQAVQVTVGGSAATAGAGSALVKYKK
jgi:hypothetical protein